MIVGKPFVSHELQGSVESVFVYEILDVGNRCAGKITVFIKGVSVPEVIVRIVEVP